MVEMANDKSIATIRDLRESTADLQSLIINSGGISGQNTIKDISNLIVFDSFVDTNKLLSSNQSIPHLFCCKTLKFQHFQMINHMRNLIY